MKKIDFCCPQPGKPTQDATLKIKTSTYINDAV